VFLRNYYCELGIISIVLLCRKGKGRACLDGLFSEVANDKKLEPFASKFEVNLDAEDAFEWGTSSFMFLR
jgi:hypothetical protein